jgi:signal peptidase I
MPRMSRKQWFMENVVSLALALLLVFAIRSSVVEAFKIPSGSMIPTLLIGDHIFVNKFAYGIKVPFSDLFMDPINIIKRDPPKRGDIIVFIFPKDESFYYIKRVIGVPGDTIEIKNKVLYINGKEMKREPFPADKADALFATLKDPRYSRTSTEADMETIDRGGGESIEHRMMLDRNSFLNESFGPITVPPESLFVMGDNRDFSNDSRFWGFVPFKNVKGRAMIIWLSLWINLDQGKFEFRPDRVGTLLK